MDHDLPVGWKRIYDEKGAVVYLTPSPQVKITKKSQLKYYQDKGRYLEMDAENLDFGKKRRRLNKFSYVKEDNQESDQDSPNVDANVR